MFDHLLGRPSPSWKRTQVCLHLAYTVPFLTQSQGIYCNLFLAMANRAWKCWTPPNFMSEESKQCPKCDYPPYMEQVYLLTSQSEHFTPWQIIVSTLTALYAIRNFDKILGLGCESLEIAYLFPQLMLVNSS